jgi:hypothetical protein
VKAEANGVLDYNNNMIEMKKRNAKILILHLTYNGQEKK